ncbi:triosephosphate isomerase, partial [Fusarium falciforme]
DPYQDELTSELHVLVTERLVNSWKIQYCNNFAHGQDTTFHVPNCGTGSYN